MAHKKLEKDLINIQNTIRVQGVGNYTKNYETWKRIENVKHCFHQEVFNKHGSAMRVLDIGCGNGYHILLLNSLYNQKRTIHFHGIDISSVDIFVAQQVQKHMGLDNVNFEVSSIEDYQASDNSFDVILCSDVIEHLENPSECMRRIKRWLKPTGSAIITTPNRVNRIADLFKACSSRKCKSGVQPSQSKDKNANPVSFEGHGHISVKNPEEWMHVFEQCGFNVERVMRGSLIFGGARYNSRRILFAMVLILDRIFDVFAFTRGFCEAVTYQLRKPKH